MTFRNLITLYNRSSKLITSRQLLWSSILKFGILLSATRIGRLPTSKVRLEACFSNNTLQHRDRFRALNLLLDQALRRSYNALKELFMDNDGRHRSPRTFS
jgi:hypothetical protein